MTGKSLLDVPGSRPSLQGLYVVLDHRPGRPRSLLEVLVEAASAGVRLFQYRNKTGSMLEAYRDGLPLRRAAAAAGALFIVNDRCDLTLALEADGVHLGQDDLPLPEARMILGPSRLIGISTHDGQQIREAADGGADYLAFGPIFATSTKPDHAPVVGLEGLRYARSLTRLPLFAIGGITPDNATSVWGTGANGIAVISAILQAADVTTTVRRFMSRL